MVRFLSSQRFLAVYSGAVTLLFFGTVVMGVDRETTRVFDQVTVHRLNIVEPDGTLRMVLTDQALAPGAYVKNKEYRHPSRKDAGLLFYDNEGTEDGGLIYGLAKDDKGNLTGSHVHLSFDQYMQDQIFTVDAGQDGPSKFSTLTMQDRGNYTILEALEASNRISSLPESQQGAAWQQFRATHPGDATRVVLGRVSDGGAVLRLKDRDGRDRILLQVAADGTPSLQFLDSKGKVFSELPPSASPTSLHP
jgi:hypothetical protein